jgi:methylmalonyl-CoA/ethylmalonyl-CoA epimerase
MTKLVHVGIAVNNMDQALLFFRDTMKLDLAYRQVLPTMRVEVAGLTTGESELELLCPTEPDTGLAKFLAGRGEGIHHVCLEVDDLDAKLKELAGLGVELIDQTPRIGGNGRRLAFVNPKSTHGVLIEFYEREKA